MSILYFFRRRRYGRGQAQTGTDRGRTESCGGWVFPSGPVPAEGKTRAPCCRGSDAVPAGGGHTPCLCRKSGIPGCSFFLDIFSL